MEEEIDLRPYVRTIIRHLWLIIGAAVLFGLAAYLITSLRPPVYQTSALVAVLEPTQNIQFDTRFTNVSSRSALLKVLPELAESPQLVSNLVEELAVEGIDTGGQLSESLTAQAGRDPILLYLRVNHSDPETAAAIANKWAELFVALANDVYANRGENRLLFYEAQFEAAGTRLDDANAALIKFQGENRFPIATNEFATLKLAHATTLTHTHELETLTNDIAAVRAQQKFLTNSQTGLTDQFTALVLQAQSLNLPEAAPFWLQASPESITEWGRREQTAFLDSLDELVSNAQQSSTRMLAEMEPRLLAVQQEVEQLTAETNRLIADRDLALETYLSLSRKLDEERIALQETNSGFRLASQATIPLEPGGLGSLYAAAIGGLAGLLLAALGVVLWAWWRDKGISPTE